MIIEFQPLDEGFSVTSKPTPRSKLELRPMENHPYKPDGGGGDINHAFNIFRNGFRVGTLGATEHTHERIHWRVKERAVAKGFKPQAGKTALNITDIEGLRPNEIGPSGLRQLFRQIKPHAPNATHFYSDSRLTGGRGFAEYKKDPDSYNPNFPAHSLSGYRKASANLSNAMTWADNMDSDQTSTRLMKIKEMVDHLLEKDDSDPNQVKKYSIPLHSDTKMVSAKCMITPSGHEYHGDDWEGREHNWLSRNLGFDSKYKAMQNGHVRAGNFQDQTFVEFDPAHKKAREHAEVYIKKYDKGVVHGGSIHVTTPVGNRIFYSADRAANHIRSLPKTKVDHAHWNGEHAIEMHVTSRSVTKVRFPKYQEIGYWDSMKKRTDYVPSVPTAKLPAAKPKGLAQKLRGMLKRKFNTSESINALLAGDVSLDTVLEPRPRRPFMNRAKRPGHGVKMKNASTSVLVGIGHEEVLKTNKWKLTKDTRTFNGAGDNVWGYTHVDHPGHEFQFSRGKRKSDAVRLHHIGRARGASYATEVYLNDENPTSELLSWFRTVQTGGWYQRHQNW